MPNRTVGLSVTLHMPEMFLSYILSTAMEGGSNYWIQYAQRIEQGTIDGESHCYLAVRGVVVDEDEDDSKAVDITLKTIEDGIVALLTRVDPSLKRPDLIGEFMRLTDPKGWDEIDYDAEAADIIVQLGLWGKVIYG